MSDRKRRRGAGALGGSSLAALASVLLVTCAASAEASWQGSLTAGVVYQGWTDIDDPDGEFDFWEGHFTGSATRRLGEESRWGISLQGEYRAFSYRFDGLPLDAGWDDAHIVRLSPRLTYALDPKWTLFGGPIAEFSGESGADFSKSMRGGALLGFQWRPREGLMIGLGVLGMNQIGGDFLFQPIVLLDWQITERWRITTQSWTSRGGELSILYSLGQDWTLSLSGGRAQERFRLDGSEATVGKGVGEESSLPFTLMLSKLLSDRLELSVYAGVVVDGELRVEDQTGNNVGVSDYERSFFGGAAVKLSF